MRVAGRTPNRGDKVLLSFTFEDGKGFESTTVVAACNWNEARQRWQIALVQEEGRLSVNEETEVPYRSGSNRVGPEGDPSIGARFGGVPTQRESSPSLHELESILASFSQSLQAIVDQKVSRYREDVMRSVETLRKDFIMRNELIEKKFATLSKRTRRRVNSKGIKS